MNLWLDQLVGCESVVDQLVVNLWLDQLVGCESVVGSVGWL